MRDEEANIMVKAWYAEHFDWATTWAAIKANEDNRSTIPSISTTGSGGKGGQKRFGDELGTTTKAPRADDKSEKVKVTVGNKQISVSKAFEKMVTDAPKQPGSEYTSDMYKRCLSSAQAFFAVACRNCFAAGRGAQQHKFADCKKAGNKCVLLCPKCKKGNHWVFDCTA